MYNFGKYMINVALPENKNIKINNYENMPEKIGNKLYEAQGTLNNYAKSKKAKISFYDIKSVSDKNNDEIAIFADKDKSQNFRIFAEDKASKKPLLRQLYETVQDMCGDKSPIEKMQADTLAKLRKIGKIK